MISRTIQSSQTDFTYTGNRMDSASGGENFTLSWDENGQLTLTDQSSSDDTSLVWNWDDKLRSATKAGTTINLKYGPLGNRIYKDSGGTGRKYIVDIVGDLPVILLELDSSNNIKKTYIYANSQIIAQHDGDDSNDLYFYLHDRLGNVRQIINTSGTVVRLYTYNPFGETLEVGGTLSNPFMFTGQFFDSETGHYFFRARQYDPYIYRFISVDPIFGKFEEPLTLHVYLYCINDPVNYLDPDGKWALALGASASGNLTIADFNPYNWQQRTLGAALGGVERGIGSLVGYYSIMLPYYTWLTEYTGGGGTAGGAFVVAHNEEKAWNKGWSMGGMGWVAGGASLATSRGGSATIDIGFSPEAQHIRHLSGPFTEFGGSFGTGTPFIPFLGINTGGFTVSIAENEEIGRVTLWTGSLGWGSAGAEGHSFVGRTWVGDPWWEN